MTVGEFNPFVTRVATTDAVDAVRAVGSGALVGVQVGVKDNIDVAGMPTGNGSALFAEASPAERDAEAVAQLRAAGAVIVGKTHMTELACGTDGRNPFLGDAQNPYDPAHHAGGSSSGSAVAVASGLVDVALGSDTGGSIRVPAAACGVVGLKPTFGRVLNDGMSVGAIPLDHIGPIAADVDLARVTLQVMQRPEWPAADALPPVTALRVGVLGGPFLDDCTNEVLNTFGEALHLIEGLGVGLYDIDVGDMAIDLRATDDHANVLGRDLFAAFGDRISAAPSGVVGAELQYWHELYASVTDDMYDAALAEQRRVTVATAEAMRQIDLWVCPSMRAATSTLADVATEEREVRTGNLALFNMTGQPSLTMPFGTAANGLPLGLLITGRWSEDELVLAFAAAIERAIR